MNCHAELESATPTLTASRASGFPLYRSTQTVFAPTYLLDRQGAMPGLWLLVRRLAHNFSISPRQKRLIIALPPALSITGESEHRCKESNP